MKKKQLKKELKEAEVYKSIMGANVQYLTASLRKKVEELEETKKLLSFYKERSEALTCYAPADMREGLMMPVVSVRGGNDVFGLMKHE